MPDVPAARDDTSGRAGRAPSRARAAARWRFPAAVLALLAILFACTHVQLGGDVVEYTTDTVALASHATPDIRHADIERTLALLPELDGPLRLLDRQMSAGAHDLYAAFARGRDGKVYPIHFFGFAALAAVPFRVFDALGIPPFKAFQAVNYAAIFVLALALRRFFGSDRRAALGLALFFGCGGALYMNWTSPECVSAAGLLAALLFWLADAPLAAGLLGGLAGQQNPTIVFFFAFAPLLKLALDWRAGAGPAANARAQLTRPNLAGLALGMAVFALPPLFNLVQYGVPNLIARRFSNPDFVGAARLASFYFDLNQGMVLGIPGVLALLAFWRWRRAGLAALALCLLFTLAVAVPALAVLNWNSGAAGIMRYAFWAAMPILLALLLRLRAARTWPALALAAALLAQAGAMVHASSYSYVEFSPLARLVLAHAPRRYHPEPEIFAERMGHNDDYIKPERIYVMHAGGVRKTLFHPGAAADGQLCGSGAVLDPAAPTTRSAYGWRYVDGTPACRAGAAPQVSWQATQFRDGDGIARAEGWSEPGFDGGDWNGMWSLGERSRLVLDVPPGWRHATLLLRGAYLEGNDATRVRVDGVDLGWQHLDRGVALALPQPLAGGRLTVDLEHQAPHAPGPGDARALALFLREISLRGAATR